MANIITTQTLIDGTRRGRVHMTGLFDSATQEAQAIKVNTWGLAGALSLAANSLQLLAGNGNPRSAYNVAITGISWSMPAGLGRVANLAWQGSTNTQFFSLDGTGSWDPGRGVGLTIDPTLVGGAPGHTGNLVFSTIGFAAGDGYTVTIDYNKDPASFDQGQIARPKDFNIIVSGNNA